MNGTSVPLLLESGNFVTRFSATDPRNHCAVVLHRLLASLGTHDTLELKLEWLEDLAGWVHNTRGAVPGRDAKESKPDARLRLLLDALDELPEQKEMLRALCRQAVVETDGVRLFTDTGVPSSHGFLTEALDRISRSVLPDPPDVGDLDRLMQRLFPTADSVKWFENLPEALTARLWFAVLPHDDAPAERLKQSMREAAIVLATRIAALGVSNELRERTRQRSLENNPFMALAPSVRAVVRESAASDVEVSSPVMVCRETLSACRRLSHDVVASLDQTGISLELVYRLELINRQLDRLYTLLAFLAPASGSPVAGGWQRFMQTLMRGGVRDKSVLELWRTNSRLLARRIIDRAGHGGEHYITRTREEWHQMVTSASGGGAVVALMALLKFLIGWAKMAPLMEGLVTVVNYGGGFVAMHFLGMTLATKQPSMTAASLAKAISDTSHQGQQPQAVDLGPLVEMVARTVRSQLGALIGNLGMVVPATLAIEGLVRLATGHPLLDVEYAKQTMQMLDPIGSASLFYAAVTGVCLWLSSLFAGAVENWAVVRRLPQSIASNHWARRLLGPRRAQSMGHWFDKHVGAVSGYIALAVMLALTPVFSTFSGLPVGIRHITFSAAQLTFSGAALGLDVVSGPVFIRCMFGVLLIGSLNFGVSFALAMWVALRAKEVGGLAELNLLKAIWVRFKAAPLDFFRAPKSESAAAAPSHH